MKKNLNKYYTKIDNCNSKKELQKLNNFLKKFKDKCNHDFTEWEDISITKYEYYNEPFQVKQGYILVTYPQYKRICKKCGFVEISNDISKKFRK